MLERLQSWASGILMGDGGEAIIIEPGSLRESLNVISVRGRRVYIVRDVAFLSFCILSCYPAAL